MLLPYLNSAVHYLLIVLQLGHLKHQLFAVTATVLCTTYWLYCHFFENYQITATYPLLCTTYWLSHGKKSKENLVYGSS